MMLSLDPSGTVTDVAFSGRGCAISQASASMLTDEIRGRSLDEVRALKNQDILDLLGIEISPARLKCALLSIDTLHHAIDERDGATGSEPSGVQS
jgi:nitrogen fixation NifU-like protein